jgi:hypothetical protein
MTLPEPDVSPEVVRQLCHERMWSDDCDDYSRLVLEAAHDTIRHLMCRCGHLSKLLEVAEADRDLQRRINYGSQKGGAA